MSSAATIRLQIEAALARKIPSALTPAPRVIRPVAPTGVGEVDELLEGGLPIGAITEMVGPESSGRTAVALSFLRHLTHAGRVCAWIDVSDTLSPESAAAAGIDLARMLWVRCGVSKATTKPSADYKFSLPEKYLIAASAKKGLHGGGCGGHPRNEVKGLPGAVSG
ncbi:MAG: recombinase RecA, partial [Silvibacterium sp.]